MATSSLHAAVCETPNLLHRWHIALAAWHGHALPSALLVWDSVDNSRLKQCFGLLPFSPGSRDLLKQLLLLQEMDKNLWLAAPSPSITPPLPTLT